ncbi:MAG: hypothetical protein ACD_45C00708G0007 [uncultured bacterium]|nr:MAG: hypothetical protein ACD_45C00708G0007 [uncultured bacterium]
MSMAILLGLLSGEQIVWGQTSPQDRGVSQVLPQNAGVSLQSDLAQFQSWLKNNGQGRLLSAQSLPPSSSLPPPIAIPVMQPQSRVMRSKPMTYSQSQRVMLKSLPPANQPSPEAAEAFDSLMQQNIPMTPQQVLKLRQLIDESQRAAATPPTIPPKPVSSTIMVNLAPGTTPPAIRLAQGYVTSLVFVDSTGSPWPVASFDIGDPKKTNIQWDGKSNVLLIQATSPYGDSDLVIRLVGLPTPVTLALVLGQRVVDYRTDIHVAGIGPNAKDLPTGTGLPNSANQLLLNVLDGVAPPGSKQLKVLGGDCLAWLLGDKMYLRTRLTVLSPGWIGRMVSPDGMYAYEIQKSSSVLVSQYGEPIELKIEGF